MTKYELIDSIALQVDALLDMRGTEKCRTALDIMGKLAALKSGLEQDERAAEAREGQLRAQLAALRPEEDDETETIAGRTYRIGAAAEEE